MSDFALKSNLSIYYGYDDKQAERILNMYIDDKRADL